MTLASQGLLAARVYADLLEQIQSGSLRLGQRLPAETQLAEKLNVSRATLREALRLLQERGYVRRGRGAGTFVTFRPKLTHGLEVNYGLSEAISARNMTPGTRNLTTFGGLATREEAAQLDILIGSPIHVIEHVHTADGRPVIFAREIIPRDFLPGEDIRELLSQQSLYELIQKAGLPVSQGIATLTPTRSTASLSSLLSIPRGTTLMRLQQTDYGQEGRPLMLSDEYYVGEFASFTVHRRGPSV